MAFLGGGLFPVSAPTWHFCRNCLKSLIIGARLDFLSATMAFSFFTYWTGGKHTEFMGY